MGEVARKQCGDKKESWDSQLSIKSVNSVITLKDVNWGTNNELHFIHSVNFLCLSNLTVMTVKFYLH